MKMANVKVIDEREREEKQMGDIETFKRMFDDMFTALKIGGLEVITYTPIERNSSSARIYQKRKCLVEIIPSSLDPDAVLRDIRINVKKGRAFEIVKKTVDNYSNKYHNLSTIYIYKNF